MEDSLRFDTHTYTQRSADGINAELSLLAALPDSIANGVVDRVEEFARDPWKLVGLVGSSAAIGAGISLLGRSRELGPAAIKFIPGLLGSAALVDASVRIGIPLAATWADPGDVDNQKVQLGKNVGGMLVDYAAMGIGGYAGARMAAGFSWGKLGSSSLGRDPQGLAQAIRESFVRPTQLRDRAFTSELTEALTSAGGGQRTPEIRSAIRELNQSMSNLQRGLNDHLLKRKLMPRVHFEWDAKTDSLGESISSQAAVSLQVEHITTSSMTDVVNTVAHELTHVEQDYLMLRRISDELGIGKQASAGQVGELRARIEAMEGEKPSKRFIDAALKLRAGKALTQTEAARADKLIAEDLQYNRNAKLDSELEKRKDRLNDALGEVDRDPQRLARELQSDKTLRQYFGEEPADAQLQAAIGRLAGRETPAAGRSVEQGSAMSPAQQKSSDLAMLRTALDDSLRATKNSLERTSSVYYESLCEREARTIGARVAWRYVLDSPAMPWLLACGSAGTVDGIYYTAWLGNKVRVGLNGLANQFGDLSGADDERPFYKHTRHADTLTGR